MGFLKKLFDQVNPFDGGKTWKNPTPTPAPRPQPAQTPAPRNMNFAGSLSYGKPNAIGPAQTPSKATKVLKPVVPQVDIKNRYAQINSPSYGSGLSGILNKAKDVVDANTPQDQFKRNQALSPVAPPNQTYQQQQATNPSNLTKASNFTSSVARTVGAPMVANVDLARAGVAQVTGNQTARNNALNSAKNNTLKIPNIAKDLAVGTIESSKQVGRGLANASGTTNNAQNAQSLLNDQLAQQRITAINRAKQGFNSQQDINRFTNYADNLWGNSAESTQTQVEAQKEIQKQVDPIRNALAIADVGLTATSFGVAGATKAGASKVTANALEQNLAKNMAKDSALKAAQTAGRNEIIRQSGLTGSMGAFQGAISPYIVKDPGTVTTKDVLGGGATGAILGGVLPGAFVGASKFADPISKATNNVFKNSLNQGGYVQAGPTPKNIHFEDHGTMGDFIDYVKGSNPIKNADEAFKFELEASRIAERYGITPIGNNKDPLVNLANGFQKRLDLDQANKVGMFAESGSPVSLNQQGSIPNPLQAFDKLKNKLNGSALDTTVKPATPENVYGVNALEKVGNKLNRALGLKDSSQGGFAKLPGKGAPTEKTVSGKEVSDYWSRELGVRPGDSGMLKIAESGGPYKLQDVPIKDILANDQYLAKEIADNRSMTNVLTSDATGKAAIINKDGVLDGYHRIAAAYKADPNGTVKAYISTESPIIKKAKSPNNGASSDGRIQYATNKSVSQGAPDPMAKAEQRMNKGLGELSDIRKQYSNDQEFFDKVILENQEAKGEIGDFARHIARRDATEGSLYNKNYLTEILDDELAPTNSRLDQAIAKSAQRDELARSIRELEKSTGQKGLYQKVAKEMQGMTEKEQIAYMGNAMKQARDSGVMAADFINKQNGYTPKAKPIVKAVGEGAPIEKTPTLSPKNQAELTAPAQKLSQKKQPLSQGKQKETSKPVVDNTSAPIIPTESVKNPEAFIPEAKLASQGKPPKQATAKLLDSAKKSDVIPEDMVQAIDPTRSVKTNKETWTKAGQKLHELGDDGALNYFHENHGADSNAVAWRLYEKRLARGDNKGAQELLADMTTRSIENGQAAQAWAMIKRLDPKYITQKLDRQVDTFKKSDKYSDRIKKRIDWSADKQARISKYATDMSNDSTLDNLARTNNKDEIAQITGIQDEGIIKGLSKTNDPERIKMLLTTNFNKEINSILPSGLGDKAVAYWKSGLLSAPVTHVRNIVGNTTNSAFNTIETPIAGLLDSTFGRALTPTKRTVSANPLIGQGKGYKQGGQDFADALRYGITKDDAGKFDYKSINWNKNNPVEQHIFKPFTDAIFRTLGAEDKIFKQPGVMHSLYNQADAAAISAGKRGDAKWMANWVENAPAIVKEQAKKEGGAWVFQKDTVVVSSAMRGLKNAVKREHPGFEKVIDGIQPFVNVPAAIGSELLTYTPAGLLRVGNKARKALNKNIDMSTRDIYRREAMKDLSKTTVGGGLIAAGLAMGYSGDASGTMPPKNTKEYDVWMQENRQANSIRVGNKWFNINSIGPQASLFNAAAQTGAWMKRNEGKGKTNDPLTSAVAFGGNVATNWFNSSSLTGASNAQKAISDPVRYGQDYAARQLTSFIPNAAKRLGAGVDPNMREGDSFKDAVVAQIPFARTNAPVKTDSTGTPVVNNAYGAMGMKSLFDPFNVSTAKDGGNSAINKTANKSGMAVQDLKEAKAITKSGYGKEWAKLSEDDIKNKAIEGDQQAQQVYDSLQAMEKVYAPKNVPTKGLSQSAEDILNKSKKFTESGKKAWGAKPSDSNDAKTSLKNWMNGKDVPVTNEIAVEWAKYEQKRVKGELSPLEQNEAKTTLLRKAYSSSLNEDERKYYSVADDKLIGAVQKGWVSQESINKALAVDKQLLELGLTTKSGFGKKVWNALGLSMPSVAGASSSTRSTGRRSGGRVAKKSLKVTKSKIPQAFLSTSKLKSRRSSTNGSLRKLLASAKV